MWLSLTLLACNTSKPPQNYDEIGIKTACSANDISCQMKECRTFFESPPPSDTPQAQKALSQLCISLEQQNHPVKQACGVPACYLLPFSSPEAAAKQLQNGTARTGAQKIARQTIFRGIIDQGALASFLSSAKGANSWLNLLVLEALCEEGSSAKQLNLPCAKSDSAAAKAAWAMYDTFPPSDPNHHAVLNLAMTLDPKGIAPLLLTLALNDKEEYAPRKAAAQSLNIAMLRGYQLPPDFKGLIEAKCAQGDLPLKPLCF